MRALVPVFLSLGLTGAAAQPAPAPQPGRYALSLAECRAGDIFLTLGKDRLDLPVMSCTGLAFTAEAAGGGDVARWLVAAKQCNAEGGGKPGPQRFHLEARGTSLQILWADGTKSARMTRCSR